MGVNPYEADPKRVPKKDPYLSRSPHYGRYAPQADDFTPPAIDWHTGEAESSAYWKEIIDKHCTTENSLNVVGSRDAFAVGKVIIRIDRNNAEGSAAERYAVLNANELVASRKAEEALKDLNVAVPIILFCGTIDERNIVVETRIPGVSLEVAWKYLSETQKQDFKSQCQRILQRVASVDDPPTAPSYVCQGLNTLPQPDIPDVERDILFAPREDGEELCLVHNDMVRPNIIVDDGRVVGIMGWRQSGYFGHDRAQRIHRLLRMPERSHIFASGERSTHDQAWSDLYDSLLADAVDVQNHDHQNGGLQVKAESPAASIEKVPMSPTLPLNNISQLDGTDEHPTPKKITDLKRGSISRASSIDRSSPSAPINPSRLGPNARKSSSVSTKKASTAKRVQPKKRKIDALESESVGERRSNSPASSRASKGPATKKLESVSTAGPPAPEGKKGGRKTSKKTAKKVSAEAASTEQQEEEELDDSDVENPDEVFCICRKPDNHTWMIGCDGGCEDWFHGKCVNINQEDEELIDRYICPNCNAAGKGKTTWKRMCRLKGCRKPARISKKKISKYCSDDHGREFMRRLTQRLTSKPGPVVFDRIREINNRDSRSVDGDGDSTMETNDEDDEHDPPRIMPDDLGSRGGVLTIGDLKAVIMSVSSAEEFRRLGERLIPPLPASPADLKKEEKKDETKSQEQTQDSNNKIGLDIHPPDVIYTTAEEAKLQKLRKRREEYRHRGEMIAQRSRFLGLVRARAKTILDRLKAKEPKGGWKDICGFDARMSWNEEELDEWLQTEAGRKAFEEDRLEAEPVPNHNNNGSSTGDKDGDQEMQDAADDGEEEEENVDPQDTEFAELSRGVCIKKRCDRHKQWVKFLQQDIDFEKAMLKDDLEACEKEAKAIVEGAVLRIYSQQG